MNTPPDDIKRYLHKLDQGTLSPTQRKALLETLHVVAQGADEDTLLALDLSALIALGSAHAPLSRAEADALFEQVTKPPTAAAPSPAPTPTTSAWFKRQGRRRVAAMMAAAATVAGLWLWWRTPPAALTPHDPTIKSAQGQLTLSLQVLLGERRDGQAIVSRALAAEAIVAPYQHLLFRYRLSQPAWLALSVQHRDAPATLLWQSEGAHQAGDFELSAKGQALALPLSAYAPGPLHITLWASSSPQPWEELLRGQPCAACVSDQLTFTVSQ